MKTGYVQIFSEQAVMFHHPNDYDVTATAPAFEFSEVPEWIVNSMMFKLLSQENKIRLIQGKQDVADVENVSGKISKQSVTEAIDNAETTEVENNVDYSSMKAKQLYDICVEKGIEAEKQQSKEYYINLLND